MWRTSHPLPPKPCWAFLIERPTLLRIPLIQKLYAIAVLNELHTKKTAILVSAERSEFT